MSEKVRINSAHSILWYFEKNTSSKYPEWRNALLHFFFQLYEITKRNYSVDVVLKLVDGIDILFDDKLVCFLHVRQQHILLHLHESSLLYKHVTTKKFLIEHQGAWKQMFKIKTAGELDAILSYLNDLPVKSKIEYNKSRRIPANIQKEVWERDKGMCSNPKCKSTVDLHFDLIIPHSKNGSSTEAKNIQILCAKCNLSKGNRRFV
jgi:hypothetical protein